VENGPELGVDPTAPGRGIEAVKLQIQNHAFWPKAWLAAFQSVSGTISVSSANGWTHRLWSQVATRIAEVNLRGAAARGVISAPVRQPEYRRRVPSDAIPECPTCGDPFVEAAPTRIEFSLDAYS
jgi:hypothetical protein